MNLPEPWLRGTHLDLDPIVRQVVHALELTSEDVARWCAPLSEGELNLRVLGVAPVAFHLRHIARSLDRLLTYAEGMALNETQMAALRSEMQDSKSRDALFEEFSAGLERSLERVRLIPAGSYSQVRGVGRASLPSTVGGLLVHCAEHTQRHTGQAITTAKVVLGMRSGELL